MKTCFVIQPFDKDKFDKRYDDIIKPAIKECGYEPYRVDRDPSVEKIIDAVEEGISNSALCVAEITTDNPNVWYEVGYAYAKGKRVIMLCSDERDSKRFPFDISHKNILTYQTTSGSDFDCLKVALISRIKASNMTKNTAFPTDFEIKLLKHINNQQNTQNEVVPKERISEKNSQEVLQALKNLTSNGFLEFIYTVNEDEKQSKFYRVTEKAKPYLH